MPYVSTWIDKRDAILAIAAMVRDANPAAWDELKVPHQKSRRFINLVSMSLINAGIPAGVNLKRGGPDESIDAIALPNATGAKDSTGKYPGLEIIDIVGGAEGPTPSLTWGDVTQVTIDHGVAGGWKAGSLVTPMPKPPVSYPDEPTFWKTFQNRMKDAYRAAGRAFPDPNDDDAFRRFSRCGFDIGAGMEHQKAADKHISELRAELGV
jgi:hypothetical protein